MTVVHFLHEDPRALWCAFHGSRRREKQKTFYAPSCNQTNEMP